MPEQRPSTKPQETLIIVDSEKTSGPPAETILKNSGIRGRVFTQANSVLEMISPRWNGALVICSGLPQGGSLRLLKKTKEIDPDLPVVMLFDRGDTSVVVKAMRMGAYDVLQKPFSGKDIQKTILGALEKRRLILAGRRLQSEKGENAESEPFVQGRSKCMERLSETLRRAREVDTAVMLFGDAGTGKKMLARELHEKSPRGHKNFIAVNCSSIPEEVLKRDLFGYGPETFRGGPCLRSGKLASAQGGTIYLDKIDGLPLSLQDRLLDVLQAGNIRRPSWDGPKPLDVRVIASTKEKLKNTCAEGRFREELFCRLNVIQMVLPALHERLEDIPVLFQHFALTICSKYYLSPPPMTRELFQELLTADWPGNVRELKNVAERFALGFGLGLKHPMDHEKWMSRVKQNLGRKKTLAEKVNVFEKNLIAQELARTNGSVKETYLTLGVPRKTFYDKMNKHGLKRKDFLSVPGFPGKHLAFFR